MVKHVVDQLMEKGKVMRGWLGVALQPLSQELAQTPGCRNERRDRRPRPFPGAPRRGGPGAGRRDVVYDKTPVEDYHHLQRLVAETRVGKPVTLEIVRKKQK